MVLQFYFVHFLGAGSMAVRVIGGREVMEEWEGVELAGSTFKHLPPTPRWSPPSFTEVSSAREIGLICEGGLVWSRTREV